MTCQVVSIASNALHEDTLYPEVYIEETSNPLLLEREHYFLTYVTLYTSCETVNVRRLTLFTYSFGLETSHRNNLIHVSSTVIGYIVGNVAVFFNATTGEQQYLEGVRGGGLSAIAVHPSRRYVAIAEKHPDGPHIFIFTYPDLRLYRVLRNGATRSFAHISFSAIGEQLASIASDPDYMLTLWDWKKEQVILRSKAFSQDVYNVAFSPVSDTMLVTSGMGHIKFWKMSSTFTGLKLQGTVGKFGASELSDIAAFVELPDGTVLSTTETGILLLWDGGAIKCEITGKHGKRCHQGAIQVCALEEGEVITGGDDGYIRLWDLEAIQTADDEVDSNIGADRTLNNGEDNRNNKDIGTVSGSSNNGNKSSTGIGNDDRYTGDTTNPVPSVSKSSIAARIHEIEPLDELLIGKDVKILSISRVPQTTSEYILLDSNGVLWKVHLKMRISERIASFHSGYAAAVQACPMLHVLVTLGQDGQLCATEPLLRHTLGKIKFSAPGCALHYLPPVLDSTGCALLATFADGTIRFLRHNIHTPKHAVIEFMLTHVFKPHSKELTGVCISPNGDLLATTSTDKTLFFFNIKLPANASINTVTFDQGIPISPIGFLQTEKCVISMSWCTKADNNAIMSDAKLVLLLVMEDGSLSIMDASSLVKFTIHNRPVSNLSETSGKTFELEIPDNILVEWKLEDYSLHKKLQSPPLKEGEKDQQISDDIKEEDGTASDTQEEAIVKPMSADRIQKSNTAASLTDNNSSLVNFPLGGIHYAVGILFLQNGHFILSCRTKGDVGELRACHIDNPKISRLILTHSRPFSVFRISRSGNYIMAGSEDGYIFCRSFSFEHNASLVEVTTHEISLPVPTGHEGIYWKLSAHSIRVRDITLTFDDSLLCSCGEDGGVFVRKSVSEDLKKPKTMLAATLPSVEVEDITSISAYTIQEARLLTERDREAKETLHMKQQTLENLENLKVQYRTLLEQNKTVSENEQLPRERFSIDKGLKERIETFTQNKLEEQKQKLAWYTEKETLALHKLEQRYLDEVVSELFEVQALRTKHKVTTFRTLKLAVRMDFAGLEGAAIDQSNTSIRSQATQKFSNKDNTTATKADSVKNTQEARKTVRADRAILLKNLIGSKPNEEYENTDDVAVIRYAEANMGDYKLKTNKNYIVPASERVDAEKKSKQIILLKESMLSIMEQFNGKVGELHKYKLATIETVKAMVHKAQALNAVLKNKATEKEIRRIETLAQLHFVHPQDRYIVDEATIKQFIDSETATSTQGGDENFQPPPTIHHEDTTHSNQTSTPLTVPGTVTSSRRMATPLGKDIREVVRPPFEVTEEELLKRQAQQKISQLMTRIEDTMQEFDDKVKRLLRERVLIAGYIKFAEMKMITLYEEWLSLKEFEKYDNALADKLNIKCAEKGDVDIKIRDIQQRLAEKKSEIEQVIKRATAVQAQFAALIGENNKFEDILVKIYKRRVKRSKKKEVRNASANEGGEGEGAEEDAEEESESEDDASSEDNSDDGTEISDDCPIGCSIDIHREVLRLRDLRLDEEDIINDIQKAAEVLKKEHESLSKKEKMIDAALRQAEMEIQEFQTQKQQKLNELDVVIPLCINQIQYLEDEDIPQDLSSALVFVSATLGKLRHRIGELQEEKQSIRKQHRELKKMHVDLLRSKKEKQKQLLSLDTRCKEVQMLKFGNLVDLDNLEKVGVNKIADELRERLQHDDMQRVEELAAKKKSLTQLKHEMTSAVTANTERLECVIELTDQLRQMENILNSGQGSVTTEYSGPGQDDEHEKMQLMELVDTQTNEIESLQREIKGLMRKAAGVQP